LTFAVVDSANNAASDTYTFKETAATATLQLKNPSAVNVGTATTVHYGDTSATIGNASTGETVKVGWASFTGLTTNTATFANTYTASGAAVVSGSGVVVTDAVTYAGIRVDTQQSANTAITTVNVAINTVSDERAKLGAIQNRLEHTIANLQVSSENLSASESRIRDVDLAAEMVSFTKNQILQQAGTAILGQANQAPQSVLSLLR